MKKNLLLLIMMLALFMPLALSSVLPAQAAEADLWGEMEEEVESGTGLAGDKNPQQIIASVVNVLLGFLGIICVIIILWAGFEWMTAGGNEEKAKTARKRLTSAVIGLVIILSAFALAQWLLGAISDKI